jgi:hypothetical protein
MWCLFSDRIFQWRSHPGPLILQKVSINWIIPHTQLRGWLLTDGADYKSELIQDTDQDNIKAAPEPEVYNVHILRSRL